MTTYSATQRARLDGTLLASAVVVPLLTAAAALGADSWPARRFLALYTGPFFFAFFIWARLRLREPGPHSRGALAVDAAAVIAAALRLLSPAVPWSGHMVFYTYSAFTTRSLPYALLMLVLAGSATWFKLVLWDDPWSWGLGIVLGLFLAARRTVVHRARPPVAPEEKVRPPLSEPSGPS
ncbi:hypothetical protein [Longimicrobium terrae]|uniref:Uncharacterized protein n=1 Tax=Longimicrobium terrae TaxID=1639882 RepID=A0A841H830_9BACT|nr:hypothetical protein [Longimicrobium terrae]MBB4639663.1 hypothetical protein [Longimicrobium terrae]MBB6074052.1 hypothetical protein [Longimicrobium terrae]NNC32647.1 hypothetical protein [Longimicrobium terrae]